MPRCDRCSAPTRSRPGRSTGPAISGSTSTAQGPLTEAQRNEIEEITNDAVQADFPVNTFVTELERAKAMGAMALFGENYRDEVRVVEIGGPFSLELCGGTHVHNSAQIGPVTILGESSVGSGVRRVEAYVGLDSFRHLAKERALMAGLASSLKVPSEEVPARVATLVERLKAAEKELDRTRLAAARASASDAAARAEQVGGVRLVAQRMAAGMTATDLRSLVGDIRGRLGAEPACGGADLGGRGRLCRSSSRPIRPPRTPGCGPTTWWRRSPSAVGGRGRRQGRPGAGLGQGPVRHRRRVGRRAR